MSQPAPYDEIKLDKKIILEDISKTPDDCDIGYFVELDLKYPAEIKEKTKKIPFDLEIDKIFILISFLHI